MPREPKKAYDYDAGAVETKLVGALRKRREATIADLVTDTALPTIQVQEGMRQILHEYVGHLKATESGELLYTFPSGLRNQVKGFWPALRRGARAFKRGAVKVLSVAFKVWIAVMLVGYFVLFVALLVLAVLASMAASMASRGEGRSSRSRGPGIGGFYLASRIIDLLFFRLLLNSGAKRNRGEKGRPLHRSVFAYVFGESDDEREWTERERKAILRHLRSHKGVISLEEIIRLTGRSREEAERLATTLLVEYGGEPVVTERGTILYSFSELLRTRVEVISQERSGTGLPPRPLVRFSDNKPKANRWISFFNAFNLVFGSYFLTYSAIVVAGGGPLQGPSWFFLFVAGLIQQFLHVAPLPILGIGLGIVPVAFSVIFFLVPLVRKLRLERRNEAIRERNARRDIYGAVMARPLSAEPEELARELASGSPAARSGPRALPKDVGGFVRSEVEQLAAEKRAEVRQEGGSYRYVLTELAEEIEDTSRYRAEVDTSRFGVGETVFDSAE